MSSDAQSIQSSFVDLAADLRRLRHRVVDLGASIRAPAVLPGELEGILPSTLEFELWSVTDDLSEGLSLLITRLIEGSRITDRDIRMEHEARTVERRRAPSTVTEEIEALLDRRLAAGDDDERGTARSS